MRRRSSPEHPMPLYLCKARARRRRTLGLRPPHEAGQRAPERLLVELDRAVKALQELCRGKAILGLEGGVGPGNAEPLSYLEFTIYAGEVQWCLPIVAGGVRRGTHAVQPLDDVEVALVAGEVQRCISVVVSGVDRSAFAMQPLSNAEEAVLASDEQWLLTIGIVCTHACPVRHRCPRRLQVARLHGVEQPHVRAVACARARCGEGRHLSVRRLCPCKAGAASVRAPAPGQRCRAADLGLATTARGRPACCGAPAGRAGPCEHDAARAAPGCCHREVKRCPPCIAVGGVEGGTRAMQPLGDVEVTLEAGEVQWLPTIIILRPHARAVHHRRLHCRQIARPHCFEQPREPFALG
eukprot:scaffold3807_cov62-Phaeocystis_antarctica.AAC.5